MTGVKKVTYKTLFNKLNILSLARKFLFSFAVDNIEKFHINTDTHRINIGHDPHMLNANLTSYQRGVY
jgi:hypothetical protein